MDGQAYQYQVQVRRPSASNLQRYRYIYIEIYILQNCSTERKETLVRMVPRVAAYTSP